ncbi:multidrug efflux SMR transporter [Flaviflexus salsibiostraticola]|uniref:Multidrug efflux SMR transporter n=1 Tax=Flaviflexus salsibiostraticola TaxID=1282737 RepID=A0A3Q8WTW7_9ACTO|nr:multidrug efflux SMR transporter [Flaviflexus salsibiostraticola]AZN30193.1 multidrug efflux SMR transporter [Flaviflexus salsibiostraticola]
MNWLTLILSGVLEAVWATALGASNGLTVLGPTIVFLIALVISTIGLAIAMKTIPTATAYAVWTGIGASLTVVWAMLTGAEPFSLIRITLIVILIACIMGLKASEGASAQRTTATAVGDNVTGR